MKEDISIPTVKDVFIVAVHEKHEEFKSMDWNTYIINNTTHPLEMVLIVSKGFDGSKFTSTMRHSIKVLPAKSFAKVEFLQNDVLALNNEYQVSFFDENKMYDKKYIFKKNAVKSEALVDVPLMKIKGIFAD